MKYCDIMYYVVLVVLILASFRLGLYSCNKSMEYIGRPSDHVCPLCTPRKYEAVMDEEKLIEEHMDECWKRYPDRNTNLLWCIDSLKGEVFTKVYADKDHEAMVLKSAYDEDGNIYHIEEPYR